MEPKHIPLKEIRKEGGKEGRKKRRRKGSVEGTKGRTELFLTAECQVANLEERRKIETHLLATTIEVADLGGSVDAGAFLLSHEKDWEVVYSENASPKTLTSYKEGGMNSRKRCLASQANQANTPRGGTGHTLSLLRKIR